MVCSNCIDDHDPEDCIWDGYITNDGATSASLVSLLETVADDDSGASPATTSSTEDDKPLQAITLDQVLMTATGITTKH